MLPTPKISCLMVTLGRPAMVHRSTACYLKQTYPNRELVILSQGGPEPNEEIRSYVSSLGRSDIHFITAPAALTLGAMRNLSIELSTGSYICQWDDDDFHHPLRLSTQYGNLLQDGVVAALYMEHLKFFETTGEIYWIDWSVEVGEDRRYLPGTVMFPKIVFHKFKNLLYPESGRQSNREEDWSALQKFCSLGRIAPIRAGYQYIYSFHGDNTYWLEHHQHVLKKRVYSTQDLLERKGSIESALTACGVGRCVIRSLSEVAFIYEPSDFCTP